MKNKVLIAMGIGITAALAPMALGDVEAKADTLSPIEQQEVDDSEIPTTNEGKIDANNETVGNMQEQQEENAQKITTNNEETNSSAIDKNKEEINKASDFADKDDVDKLNSLGEKIKEDAAALDNANKELDGAGKKLSEAEEELTNNDGSNPSEYNALVDDVNSALDDYNGKVADSKEKNQTLRDDSDEYDELLAKVEEDTNKKLDENAVKKAEEANKAALDNSSNKAETNATSGASNANTVTSDTFADTTGWNQDLKNTEDKKYSVLLSAAENDVTSAKNTLNTAKDGLDSAKVGLDSAKEELNSATGSEAYNIALGKYKEAEKAYNTAVDTYNRAKSAYETATGTYKETLAAYADAENKDRLEKGVNKAKENNADSNPYNTQDTLTANDGKLIKDITKDSVDKDKVSTDDAGKVDDVTDAVDALGSKASALETAEAALTEAEGKLNTAKANLAGADASTITQSEYNALVDAVIGAQTTYRESINNYNDAVTKYNTAASDLVNKYNEYLGAKYKKELADIDTVTGLKNATACATNAATVGVNANIVKGNDDTVEDQSDALGKLKDANWITGQDKQDMNNLTTDWNGKLSTLKTATQNLSMAATALENAQTALNKAKASDADYASLVNTYNGAVKAYIEKRDSYNGAVDDYNAAAKKLVGKYNELRETQQGLYEAAEKAKVTPLDALDIAKTQVKPVSDVNVVNPNTVTGQNDSAIENFTKDVKAAYRELGVLTDDQINSIFDELYKDEIDNLNVKKSALIAEWSNLNDKASNLSNAVKELNDAKSKIDSASNKLNENDFAMLKAAYNEAVKKYNIAAAEYATAKTNYDSKVGAYNTAKDAITNFDKSLYLSSGGNFAKIEADTTSITANDDIMKANITKLNLDADTATVDQIMDVIAADNSVSKKYNEAEKKDLKDALDILMKGLNNTIRIGKNDVKISDLQNMIKDAAAALSDEDGANDKDVNEYNALIKKYKEFIDKYNSAQSTYNNALDNYEGITVSQYKDTEKDNTPQKVKSTYEKNIKSGHIDVKADGTFSLEQREDGKWVIKDGGEYEILGVYATETDARKSNGQKGLKFEYETTEKGKTVTKSGKEKIDWYNNNEEFSFAGVSGQSNASTSALKDEKNKSVGSVKVTSATFWVKYKVGDETKYEEFTISAQDRFKANSWFAGEDSDKLKSVLGADKVQEVVTDTKWTIGGKTFDSVDTSGWTKHTGWGSTYWTKGNTRVYDVDPTKSENWKPKDITETYYNVEGCNIFEISKYICSNNSGLDLVLSLEVLQDLKERKELAPLSALNNSFDDVKVSKEDPTTPSGIIKTGLKGLDKAPIAPETIGEITAEVKNNNVENPGDKAEATELTAGLAPITGTAITGDEVKKETDKVAPVLNEIKAPTFGELSKVDVKSVDGSKTFGTLALMLGVDSGELASATYTPIKLTSLEAKGPEGDAFIVDTLFKLALPTVGPDGPVPGPTPVDPVPGGTFIVPMANPVAPAGPAVLGARRGNGAVLGAKRGLDQAVLGAKRSPKTGDSMAMVGLLASLGSSLTGAGVAAGALKKSKKKEDAE